MKWPAIQLFAIAITSVAGCSSKQHDDLEVTHAIFSTRIPGANQAPLSGSTLKKSEFTPKFPERIDPFRFPGDALTGTVKPEASIAKATHIDVLGFAQMNEPKVILRTKDSTASVAVGERLNGVEVLEIHAPSVKLKAGNLVWIASMFDKSRNE